MTHFCATTLGTHSIIIVSKKVIDFLCAVAFLHSPIRFRDKARRLDGVGGSFSPPSFVNLRPETINVGVCDRVALLFTHFVVNEHA